MNASANGNNEVNDGFLPSAQTTQNEQTVYAQPNATNGHDTNGRIPQSQSFTGFTMLGSSEQSPQRQGMDHGLVQSPEGSLISTMTEPKNYAPRTNGHLITQEPPPKFNLGVVPYNKDSVDNELGSSDNNTNSQDPFAATAAALANPLHMALTPAVKRSDKLNELLNCPGGRPSFDVAMHPDNFPFTESCRTGKAINHGVVKIRNIPFSTKRAEVIAFLGRNSKILNDADEPVHIIMERVTSKTMDAYVEFCTLEDAMRAVERHISNITNSRPSRLGDRAVDVELSSQGSLMRDLFPLATGVIWDGATPEFKPYNAHEPWENFKGFITEEEMIMLVKHVEVPHRSPFSKECPQRPYECLISTLKKFPWSFMDRVTISQRRALFRATCELLRLLTRSLQKGDDVVNLTVQLYRRLTKAAMSCPGFTPLMKDDIAWLANVTESDLPKYNLPPLPGTWRHQYALAAKVNAQPDVINWYISIIRDQSHKDMMTLSIQERNNLQEKAADTDMTWGYFWNELGYERFMGPGFDQMTLGQAAYAELSAIERILYRALPAAKTY
ncbi:uncharacterized protein F5Z01DRAFT_674437 [Emericellopsis atlantica]|uniref:RRM domain-containing protein n=1 Tax=Emericellopsis atlantica TaxID=2614577 RepID=A0A9P7ZLY9_9HYPO|nr:uncharacterized protein F5Z01DRAFT_674437 [Emericellopsis atlantica]KAG9254121.1 hypothetical protein F5Z01DRAFT_674437 [Emericellopsis atlantica]